MKPFSTEKMGELTSGIARECLTLAEEVNLPVRDLAILCGTAPATLYRWQKAIKADELADPEGKMTTVAFMNLLIFRQAAKTAVDRGTLPQDGKKGARKWARQLAPDLFVTDAS